jgi:regulator of replication initiation timing
MGILDNAKQVAKAVEEIHNLELYQRVLSLHSDIIELVEENNHLRAEKQDLTVKLELQGKMVFDPPFYFQSGDNAPYCSACWEAKKQAIHVVNRLEEYGNVRWECPICRHIFDVESNKPAPQHFPRSDAGEW